MQLFDIMDNYFTLHELIAQIDGPNGTICQKLLDENLPLFSSARGSSHNHQAWRGGYLDHIAEVMNIGVVLYDQLNRCRRLPFSLSDALLILYLHDLEKPWKHIECEDGTVMRNPQLLDKESQIWPFVEKKIREYGFLITADHWTALKYVEGEKKDYSSQRRVQTPLAAFAHICDTWSARGWFDYPLKNGDSWQGAKRSL
ncbi:hypothetical protein HYY69_05700 [Candidatus Woesearchaeota archaeon]|nr:hypothetical protein [Candidatus Woesearchaeota archaeon]